MLAQEGVRQLVKDPLHRPKILKYVFWRRDNWQLLDAHGVP